MVLDYNLVVAAQQHNGRNSLNQIAHLRTLKVATKNTRCLHLPFAMSKCHQLANAINRTNTPIAVCRFQLRRLQLHFRSSCIRITLEFYYFLPN